MKVLEKTFKLLAAFLKKEDKIMQSRVSAARLRELYETSCAFLETEGDLPIAFAALWPTKSDLHLELGTVWVHPSYRGRGLGKLAFEKCSLLVPDPEGVLVYLVTRNPRVAEMAKAHGWNRWHFSDWSQDKLWKDVVPPWDKNRDKNGRPLPPGDLFIWPHENRMFDGVIRSMGL